MITYLLIALKISYTDLRYRKIHNLDLSLLFVAIIFHRQIHHFLWALLTVILGFILRRFIGAGDTKFLALIVLTKMGEEELRVSLIAVVIVASSTLIFFLGNKKIRRIPLGPALSVGLLI